MLTVATNGRIYISYAREDIALCAPLLTALDAWGVDYFMDAAPSATDQRPQEQTQREMTSRDIMLRICTGNTPLSQLMRLEVGAFRALQAADQRKQRDERRILINLILDSGYTREPFEAATLFIDAAARPRAAWFAELARAIGVTSHVSPRQMSRRALVGYGAATAVALGSAATAGVLYERFHPVSAEAATAPHTPGAALWQMAHASPRRDLPAIPTIAGTTLYTVSLLGLTAWDLTKISAAGPARLWNQSVTARLTYNPVSVVGQVAYLAMDFSIYAFNAQTGQKLWASTQTNPLLSAPAAAGAAIVAVDEKGVLYALRASDGAALWHFEIDNTSSVLSNLSSPAADSATVYIGSNDHAVYALDAHSGAVRWKTLTRGQVVATPTLGDGIVYVGSTDGYLYALDVATGAPRWKYLTGDAVESTPAVFDGVVYFASDDGYLYTLDAATGSPYWRAPFGSIDAGTGAVIGVGPVTSQPVVTGDGVIVVDTQSYVVRSFNRSNGSARWAYHSKNTTQNAPPIGAHGVVFYSTGEDTLYAFSA